jgi:integrase
MQVCEGSEGVCDIYCLDDRWKRVEYAHTMKVAPQVAPLTESCPIGAGSTESNIIALGIQPNAAAALDSDAERERDENYFKYQGRWYQLYKRTSGRDGSYYVRFQHGGKTHKKCLETNQRLVAISYAKVLIEKVRAGKWEDVEKLKARQSAATLGKVFPIYQEFAGIQANSIKNNIWALGKIVKMALGVSKVEEVSLNELNASLVMKFQEAMVKMYRERVGKDVEQQRRAKEQALRSSRSIVHQARCLFNKEKEMVQRYEARGLKVPACVQEFLGKKMDGRDTKREYLPPADEVVQKAFTDIEKMKDTDRTTYLAFWLATGAGLRRGEILRVRWEHFVTRNGERWVSGGIGKDGERIEVPVQARAWSVLSQFAQKEGPVLGERASLEYARRINWWMKQQGWNTEKKLHELRAYVGSLIYMTGNHVAAMKFMRHKTIRMTEQFYARYGSVKTPQVLMSPELGVEDYCI